MSFTMSHDFSITADPPRVFRALTDPDELMDWFAESSEVRLEKGGEYGFWGMYTPGTPESGQRIIDLEADKLLRYSWLLHGVDTVVTCTLAPAAKGTSLAIAHEVRGDLPLPRQKEYVEDFWRMMIGNLSQYIETGAPVEMQEVDSDAPEVVHLLHIDAPVELVFRALLEPERINQWFGSTNAIVDPRVGGTYNLGWKATIDGKEVAEGPTRILALVENERLVLDWPDWRGDPDIPAQTVSFSLAPDPKGGTFVTFVHSGFQRAMDISDYGFGWLHFMNKLKSLVERAPW